jgi:AraC-like DNA-binding protein
VKRDVDPLTAPAVAFAIRHRYAPGEVKVRNSVESRLVVWALSGKGTITTSGREIVLEPGIVVVLPWHHDVTYQADNISPFFTATVHVVPWIAPDHEVEPMAAHGPHDPLYHDPFRDNVPWPGYEGVRILRDTTAEKVSELGALAIDYFGLREHDPRLLRAYAVTLVRALLIDGEPTEPEFPASLSSVLEYIRIHLPEPMTREDLAGVAGCSISAIERQFQRYLGTSPQKWIRDQRLDFAARMLTNSTLRVSEIAKRVGINDPLHFSRLFRAKHGIPPREYARRNLLS